MTNIKFRPWWAVIVIAGAFLLYYFCLPYTVQTNDTGEMVANSYLLHLMHPPGYPLFMWLYHAFMKVAAVSTPFFRASLFTALLACATLTLLFKLPPSRTLLGTLCLATFATGKVFWEYAVLPDVFMLHTLMSAFGLLIFLGPYNSRFRVYALGALMGFGIANHHTAIFWAPFFIYAALEHKIWKDVVISAALSLVICAGFYATLMYVTQPHLLDWRYLTSTSDLMAHFFRKDYGTFRLALIGQASGPFHVIWLFVKTMLTGIPLLAIGAFAFPKKDRRLHIVGLVLAAYILIFLSLCNLPTFGDYISILERFFVFPALLIAVLGLYGLNHIWPTLRPSIQRLVLVGAAASTLANISQRSQVDYSKDTLIEDFALDLLERAGAKPNSILLLRTDTMLVGTRYVQYVLGVHPEVPAFNVGALPRPHINPFIKNLVPGIEFIKNWKTMADLEPAFVKANADKIRIVAMVPLETPGFALRKLRAGYEVVPQKEAGPVEDGWTENLRTAKRDMPNFRDRFSLRLFLTRCDYYLDHADRAYTEKRFADADKLLKSALETLPNCYKAKERQCQLFSEQKQFGNESQCQSEYELLKATYITEP